MRKYGLLLCLLVAAAIVKAQQFGGNPPSIKWKQVNIPAAKVIFPAGMDSTGLRVADIINRMNPAIKSSIGNKQKQISIVLQNQTTIANGYVSLAPFRSEFYLTPEQNNMELGSLPWPDQLAIHEFRHVQQYNNFNVGLSKALGVVFGEGGRAIANSAAIPDWFFEGDAVFNETLVSQQGRGRLPDFLNGYRALWAAGKDYSWMKLRNGSYKDYTPNWYPTGYMLVAYGREKYGNQFWKNVTQDAAAYNGLFYPFQKAIKKYSGEDYKQFRTNGLSYFKQQFNTDKQIKVTPDTHFIADQEYPVYINDNTLVYMKTTYNHCPVFVVNERGKEKDIAVRSVSLDNYFNYNNGKIVYAAYRPDIRWHYRDYSELKILDIQTGKERQLTRHTKYFSPAFSADGTTIVAVEVVANGKSELHLLNAVSGKLSTVVPNKDGLFYTYPKFYGDGKIIVAVRNLQGKMSLALIDVKTGGAKYLLPFSYQPIAFLTVQGDMVYFTATSGIYDRLFRLDISTDKLYQFNNITGNQYQPAVASNKLSWVEQTAYGYQVRQTANNSAEWSEIATDLPGGLPDFKISTFKTDSASNLLATVANQPLPVTPYNKAYHLFNFHSLIPYLDDPNYTLALVGQNVLNTFQSQLSFNYNRDEGYKQFGFDAVYGALFPYITAGYNYTFDRRGLYNGSHVYWNESDLHGGLQLPLNLSRGRQLTGLTFGSDIHYNQTAFQQAYRAAFKDKNYTYLNNYIIFSTHIQQAKQNIYPRLGQTLSINYKSAIDGLNASQFLASGTFYLPGLFANHNLVINAAYQQKAKGSVIDFANNFPFARGYTAENLYQLNKIGVNYHFPILYPDAGVANAVYFLRIRGNLFYDYTHANDFYSNGTNFKADFRSTGAEVYFDTKVFNQQSITIGLRYSRLLDRDLFGGRGPNQIEIVLPVSIF
ncbi:MAG: hypothetical protein ABI367_05795 [Mucilaginibacter sp.]